MTVTRAQLGPDGYRVEPPRAVAPAEWPALFDPAPAKALTPWPAAVAESLRIGQIPDDLWNALFPAPCPRFGRMDDLSRLALIAVELLGLNLPDPDQLGVILQTHTGSLATDKRFLASLSPSVFTYTLPSTAIGELCIRHRLRGPVLCLLAASSADQPALAEAQAWLAQGELATCLCLSADAGNLHATALYLKG